MKSTKTVPVWAPITLPLSWSRAVTVDPAGTSMPSPCVYHSSVKLISFLRASVMYMASTIASAFLALSAGIRVLKSVVNTSTFQPFWAAIAVIISPSMPWSLPEGSVNEKGASFDVAMVIFSRPAAAPGPLSEPPPQAVTPKSPTSTARAAATRVLLKVSLIVPLPSVCRLAPPGVQAGHALSPA